MRLNIGILLIIIARITLMFLISCIIQDYLCNIPCPFAAKNNHTSIYLISVMNQTILVTEILVSPMTLFLVYVIDRTVFPEVSLIISEQIFNFQYAY